MFGPNGEVVGVKRELFLKSFHDFRIFEIEHRTVARCKTAVDFFLRGSERLFRDDGLQRSLHQLPECLVVFVQQQHEACRLRVECRGNVFHGKTHDFFDLCVVDRGSGCQFVIAAAVAQGLFQISFHSRRCIWCRILSYKNSTTSGKTCGIRSEIVSLCS